MKSIIKKSVVALVAVMPLFTACQSEPEYGTLLHPEEQANTDPKVYINEVAAPTNTASGTVVQTPVELVLPEDAYEFYVRLSRPVESNVVVTVAEDAAAAAAYGNDYQALPVGALAIENATVTIPAGATVSTEPVTFKVADSEAVKSFEGKGVAVIKVASIKSDAQVSLGSDHNAYYTLLTKKVTNFKDNSISTLESKTQITSDELSYTYNGYDYTVKLMDGSKNTYVYMSGGPGAIICEFNEPQPFIGMAYQYGYYPGYGPYKYDILTSSDGETWTSQLGGPVEYYSSTKVCVNLYSAVTCKYVKFQIYSTYYSNYWGDSYNTPCVGELYMYK